MSNYFTQPVEIRKTAFLAMLQRIAETCQYLATLHKSAGYVFGFADWNKASFSSYSETRVRQNFVDSPLAGMITLGGIPFLYVDERQKDGWKEHMIDWVTITTATTDMKFLTREAFKSKEPGVRVIVENMQSAGICLVSLDGEVTQGESMLDTLNGSRTYYAVANLDSIFKQSMGDSSINLKAGNSAEVWKKTLAPLFIGEKCFFETFLAEVSEAYSTASGAIKSLETAYKHILEIQEPFLAMNPANPMRVGFSFDAPYWTNHNQHRRLTPYEYWALVLPPHSHCGEITRYNMSDNTLYAFCISVKDRTSIKPYFKESTTGDKDALYSACMGAYAYAACAHSDKPFISAKINVEIEEGKQ